MDTLRPLGGAIAVVIGPQEKTVVVFDKARKNPKWKFPGGGIETGETPAVAASRELQEETGIYIPPEGLLYMGGRYRSSKKTSSHFLLGQTSHFKDVIRRGNDGEIVRVLYLRKIFQIDFLLAHREFILNYYRQHKSVLAA